MTKIWIVEMQKLVGVNMTEVSSTAAHEYNGILVSPIIKNIVACLSILYFIGAFLNVFTLFCCENVIYCVH